MKGKGWIIGLFVTTLSAVLIGCDPSASKHEVLFEEIPATFSGIEFSNNLKFDQAFNIYTYRNYYNGGGVGLADINNDGLLDVYFTGNMVDNKLFLNKGNFKFEDITINAGVAGTKAWSTGVSMADVNGDGYVDIYVCNSGDIKGDNKQNELFINNGNLTFTERAEEYGVADKGFTTHAAFFDYDKDSDLDLYILNNSYQAIGSFNLRKNERPNRDPLGGDKLMRNDGGHFTDVSEESGIYGSVIGFGLGVTIGDVNNDNWQDIYVSNDFFERDYLYINKHGKFEEVLPASMGSISGASMGADLADINNDSYPDIFVTEMLPKDSKRIKTVTTFDNWDRYQYSVANGYHHQFTRNMLQLNNSNGTFSEIGRLTGVEATEWSWGALMFDMDNDGMKDIFVANGIYQDLTNQDYLQYISNEQVVKSIISGKSVDYKKLVELIPSTPVPNYAFKNEGNLKFTNYAKEWGLDKPGFSNGAAYGDLDNDGDLDLVVNNVNSLATLYRNNSERLLPENKYLKFQLKGSGKNTFAFGTKITLYSDSSTYYLEQMPIRGFESSVDPRPNFGVGQNDTIEAVKIQWPNGAVTNMKKVATNQILKLDENSSAEIASISEKNQPKLFKHLTPPSYQHVENRYVDFDRDHLIYHMLSTEGPRCSKGDVNNDGLDDFYVGGPLGQPGALFIQQKNGQFVKSNENVFNLDRGSEDMGSEFFDADGDNDLDLYVCSGGNEFSNSSLELIDRLYLNDGKGNFSKSGQVLPGTLFESTSCVKSSDFDRDGDLDLFVGVRLVPALYGVPVKGYFLENDGKGNFKDVTKKIAPRMTKTSMISDVAWADVDGDRDEDLVVVGEYSAIKILKNEAGHFHEDTTSSIFSSSKGWWNKIKSADLDRDGDIDFVVGNHGLNSRFRASSQSPIHLYINDFDQNGNIDHILCTTQDGHDVPMVLRHDLVQQIPSLKKKFLKYEDYKSATLENIFTKDQIERSLKLEVNYLQTSVLLNDGKGTFELRPLPIEAQFAPVFGIEVHDFDDDGNVDILLGGNFYNVKPEVGRYDALYGLFLKGNREGNFEPVSSAKSGIDFRGEVRDITTLKTSTGFVILVSRNSDSLLLLEKEKLYQ